MVNHLIKHTIMTGFTKTIPNGKRTEIKFKP